MEGAEAINGARIDSMLPPDGQVVQQDIVWRGQGSLQPSVYATDVNYEREQSTDDFYAGLAFAIAVSAAVAAFQELPFKRDA